MFARLRSTPVTWNGWILDYNILVAKKKKDKRDSGRPCYGGVARMTIIFLLILNLGLVGMRFLPREELTKTPRVTELENLELTQYPQKTGGEKPPEITAEAAVVADLKSGVILWEKNADKKLRPASTTKLMTALVALGYYQPNNLLTVKRLVNGWDEAEMGLKIGDKLTVKNLIYGLLIPSGNDAAYTLADNYPEGIEQFIYSMNKRAEELHMKNTHFDNPSGIDSNNLYTTARDLSFLTKEILKNDLIAQTVKTNWAKVTNANNTKKYYLQNVNELLTSYPGVLGIKTGYTVEAGECLVAAVKQGDKTIISVILKSQNRFKETRELWDWVFNNFR